MSFVGTNTIHNRFNNLLNWIWWKRLATGAPNNQNTRLTQRHIYKGDIFISWSDFLDFCSHCSPCYTYVCNANRMYVEDLLRLFVLSKLIINTVYRTKFDGACCTTIFRLWIFGFVCDTFHFDFDFCVLFSSICGKCAFVFILLNCISFFGKSCRCELCSPCC